MKRPRLQRGAPAVETTPSATGRARSNNLEKPAAETAAEKPRVRRGPATTPEVSADTATGRLRRVNVPPGEAAEARRARRTGDAAVPEAPAVVRVDRPTHHLLVVSFAREAWPNAEAELVSLSRGLAGEDGAVVLCRIGHAPRDAQKSGADRLAVLEQSDTLRRQAALVALCRHLKPRTIILPHDPAGSELARVLAAALGIRPALGVVQIRGDGVLVPSADGRQEYSRPVAAVMSIRAVACRNLPPPQLREARPIEPLRDETADRTTSDDGLLDTDVSMLPLEEAEFIVSAGDGVRDFDSFREAATLLSATIAGSRVVCDAGILPRSRQIGASGHIARAQCYLALGISGAPQHLEGIRDCAHVIAVNTDLHAAILQRADLAIVADAQQVLPALIEAMEKRHG